MPDKAWKVFERHFAGLIGGTRAGPLGKNGPDVIHPVLAPELKERKRPLKTLAKYMAQAITNAPSGKTPIVVMHTLGDSHDNDLVVMRLAEWLKMWKEGP